MGHTAVSHRIRLRYPWSRQDGTGADLESLRVDVPDESLPSAGQDEHTEIVYRRRFNQPTGMQPEQRLWLQIDGWTGELVGVVINEIDVEIPVLLLEHGPIRLDITNHLRPYNVLAIQLRSSAAVPRLSRECILVIEP